MIGFARGFRKDSLGFAKISMGDFVRLFGKVLIGMRYNLVAAAGNLRPELKMVRAF